MHWNSRIAYSDRPNHQCARVGLIIVATLLTTNVGWAQSNGGNQALTQPPGRETAEIRQRIDEAKKELESGRSISDLLTAETYMAVRAYPRFRELIRDHAATGGTRLVPDSEPGDAFHVAGTVLDREGQPIANALIYLYHTSAKGWYSDKAAHIGGSGGDPSHARLFAYLKSDAKGRYEIFTIRPEGYPETDLPAHIHVHIREPGGDSDAVVTEIMFEDDPRLTPEWRKQAIEAGFVICPVKRDSDGMQHVEADLRLR
jgi:protocatechuate 3,4-dioxygenase beta subunit